MSAPHPDPRPSRRTSRRPASPPATVATLSARALGAERGGRWVYRDLSLTVGAAACIGVVGPNGAGKTTLLRTLAGLDPPDGGTVRLDPPHAAVGYLAQERRWDGTETVREHLRRRTGVAAAEEELEQAAAGLAAGPPGAAARYQAALERYGALSAGDADARADAVLADLGLAAAAGRALGSLSGGQRARVGLAAVLLARFDVVLLDEPTNDLDFEGLERLESYVTGRRGGTVVVSHDRAFLERTVNAVLELPEGGEPAQLFAGGWDAYLEERATARRHAEESYRRYTSQRDELAARARREREWATTGVARERRAPRDHDTAQRDFRLNRTERLASRARRTERAMAALEEVDKPWEGWQLRFQIGAAPRAGAVVARLTGAVVGRGTFSLGPLDLTIGWGERIGVVGPNGSGKSTLVAAVLGQLAPLAGQVWRGPGVVAGTMAQDRDAAWPGTALSLVLDRCGCTDAEGRSLLAKFGVGAEAALRPAATLSPGERTRVELATFQGRGVNFVVLDEPTNHLDLPAIEQLEAALAAFDGTLLLVSHDRRLLDALALTRRWTLAPGAGLTDQPAD